MGLFLFSFVSCFAKEKNILVDLLQFGVHSLLKLISPAGPGNTCSGSSRILFLFKSLSQRSFTGMGGGQSVQLISDLGNQGKL